MLDMNCTELCKLIQEGAEQQIYFSIIGVGINFNTDLAEAVTKNEGSNYFCITSNE